MEKEAAPPKDDKNKPLSRGEKIFDWLTYGGIAGVAVFIATIPTTYWAKYGGGSKYFKAFSNGLQKLGMSSRSAEDAALTTGLGIGGTLMLLPVKLAEDNKIAAIEKIDKIMGDSTNVAELENEDKQSWGSIIKARAVAWLTVFSSFKIAGMTLGDKLGHFEEAVGKKTCAMLGKPTHIAGQETKAFRYGKIAALDVFATTAASILLFVGTRFFAKKKKEMVAKDDACEVCAHDLMQDSATHHTGKTIQKIIENKKPEAGFAASVSHPSSMQLSV